MFETSQQIEERDRRERRSEAASDLAANIDRLALSAEDIPPEQRYVTQEQVEEACRIVLDSMGRRDGLPTSTTAMLENVACAALHCDPASKRMTPAQWPAMVDRLVGAAKRAIAGELETILGERDHGN